MHLRLQDASLKNLRIFEAVVVNGGFAAAQTQLGTSAAIALQSRHLSPN